MPLISIVIPAYNPGPHFAECLASISGQTFRDFEIIVIDDGSAVPVDASVVIDHGIPEDAVRIIRTDNGGPYAARRWGIAEARSAYLMSMDADDELMGADALEKVATALKATSPDMLLINASSRKDGSVPLVDYSALRVGGLSHGPVSAKPEAFRALFASDYIYNSACMKVVRREVVRGVEPPYPRIVMADDRMLDMDFLPSVRSLALLDEPLYYYRPLETSITHAGYKPDYYLQVSQAESRVLAWLDETGFDEAAWAENFLRVTCNALLGLAYNRSITTADLNAAFRAVLAQGPYRRALATGALSRLGGYGRAQLSLLEARRFKPLRVMMLVRGFSSRARGAVRRSMARDGR